MQYLNKLGYSVRSLVFKPSAEELNVLNYVPLLVVAVKTFQPKTELQLKKYVSRFEQYQYMVQDFKRNGLFLKQNTRTVIKSQKSLLEGKNKNVRHQRLDVNLSKNQLIPQTHTILIRWIQKRQVQQSKGHFPMYELYKSSLTEFLCVVLQSFGKRPCIYIKFGLRM